MKLYQLTLLRLQSYFRKPTLILALAGFLTMLWIILNVTNTQTTETLVLPIGVVDLDHTRYSDLIIQRISKKDAISIKTTSQNDALKQVSTGKLEAVYILKEGLMDKILEGHIDQVIEIVKSPVSLSAEIIGELFSAEVMRLSSNVDAANAVVKQYNQIKQYGEGVENKDQLWTDAWELTDSYWEPSPIITIDYHSTSKSSQASTDNPEMAQIKHNISEILILALLMFSILSACGPLLNEKNNGIIKRIISTGTPLWIYLLSSILTIITIHTLGLFILMLVSGQIDYFVSNFILYIIYMLWAGALGIIIIAATQKMQQLLIIIPFITLSNSLLFWKLQGYNGFGNHLFVLILVSSGMLLIAIKSFKYSIT
ncbi:MAG TPA: ABC transporter permease [Epulopiscium sp.]|nr:ABC transporter permease [Candidatus Epulonipiscium sp.]